MVNGTRSVRELLSMGLRGVEPASFEVLAELGLIHRPGAAGEFTDALGEKLQPGAESGQALEGLKALIARFDDPARPYLSRTAPAKVKLYASDYDHLARVREWSAIGEGDES